MKKDSMKYEVRSIKYKTRDKLKTILLLTSYFLLLTSCLTAFASDTPLEEFPIPTPMSSPTDIAVDRNGIVWIMEYIANKIGRFDPSRNIFDEYEITTTKSESTDMAIDMEGNIWFTEQEGNQLGKFNTKTLKFEEFDLPAAESNPASITVDSKGNIWFVEWNKNKIAMFNPPYLKPPVAMGGIKGGFSEYDIPTKMSQTSGLAADAKNNIWFVEKGGNKLGMLNHETGKIKEYNIQPAFSLPIGTVIDSKGNVWFCKLKDKKLVKFSPATGEFKDFSLPGTKGAQGMAIAKNDSIYLSMRYENKIARFNVGSGIFTEYNIPTKDSQPLAMTVDNNGSVWFTMIAGNKIGKLDVSKMEKGAKGTELKVKIKLPDEIIRK
jgi:streptogramin lyase